MAEHARVLALSEIARSGSQTRDSTAARLNGRIVRRALGNLQRALCFPHSVATPGTSSARFSQGEHSVPYADSGPTALNDASECEADSSVLAPQRHGVASVRVAGPVSGASQWPKSARSARSLSRGVRIAAARKVPASSDSSCSPSRRSTGGRSGGGPPVASTPAVDTVDDGTDALDAGTAAYVGGHGVDVRPVENAGIGGRLLKRAGWGERDGDVSAADARSSRRELTAVR
jgi:hypothetical protein